VRRVTAQVSLYPLREPSLGPAIERALGILGQRRLVVEPGRMSTLVTGSTDELFPALQAAFEGVAEDRDLVMVVTISNACPDEPSRLTAPAGRRGEGAVPSGGAP